MKLDRHVLAVLGASLALASPAAAQAPKENPKPAAAKPATSAKAPAAPSVPADPAQEAKVRARVSEYWKQRMSLNLQSIFPYYESSFRTSLTPEKFAIDYRRLNRFAPEFMGVDGVRFESPTKAVVKVKLRTKPSVLDGAELITSTDESWVLENGQWYKVSESMIPNI